MSSEPQPGTLPPRLPECCIRVLARPGWYDLELLQRVRLRPANLFVRAISSPRVAGTEVAATTIGNTIYFRQLEQFDPHSPAGLALLAHEIRHVEQYLAHGGVVRFSVDYVLQYMRGGYGTEISFEAEAYHIGSVVYAHLEEEFAYNGGQVLCQVTPAGHNPNPQYTFLTPYPPLPRQM